MNKFIELTNAAEGYKFELNALAVLILPTDLHVGYYDDNTQYTRLPIIGSQFPLEVAETPTQIRKLLKET